jgi:hypothetical protein
MVTTDVARIGYMPLGKANVTVSPPIVVIVIVPGVLELRKESHVEAVGKAPAALTAKAWFGASDMMRP